MNWELPDVQAGFGKGRGTRNQIATSVGLSKKQRNSRKTSTSASLTTLKPLTVGSQQTVENSSRDGNTKLPHLSPENPVYGSRSNRTGHGTTDWFKIGKGVHQGHIYCHLACLTYMQSTSYKMLGCMTHKLKSRFLEEILITSDMQMTPPLWQKAKKNKRSCWWKCKRSVKKLA